MIYYPSNPYSINVSVYSYPQIAKAGPRAEVRRRRRSARRRRAGTSPRGLLPSCSSPHLRCRTSVSVVRMHPRSRDRNRCRSVSVDRVRRLTILASLHRPRRLQRLYYRYRSGDGRSSTAGLRGRGLRDERHRHRRLGERRRRRYTRRLRRCRRATQQAAARSHSLGAAPARRSRARPAHPRLRLRLRPRTGTAGSSTGTFLPARSDQKNGTPAVFVRSIATRPIRSSGT